MNKKIITALLLSATLILGLPSFVGSPYFALAVGDTKLYYELKAIPLAVNKCSDFEHDDTAMDFCVDAILPSVVRELRR